MKRDQFFIVIERANQIFRNLSNKYKRKKDYLVFSSPYGQCEVTSDVKKILIDFPKMIVDSVDKERAIELIELLKDRRKENDPESNAAINRILDNDNLEFKNDTFIEIRFDKLDYEIIFEMQKDPLVSLKHTPQTRSSIRIVLGKLEELLISESSQA